MRDNALKLFLQLWCMLDNFCECFYYYSQLNCVSSPINITVWPAVIMKVVYGHQFYPNVVT